MPLMLDLLKLRFKDRPVQNAPNNVGPMSRNTVETFGLSVYFSNLFKKLIGFIQIENLYFKLNICHGISKKHYFWNCWVELRMWWWIWCPRIVTCIAIANRLRGFLRRNLPKLLFCLALVRSHLSCMPVRSATRISSRDLMILDWRVFKDERPSSYSKAMSCLILIPWKSLIYCPCRTAWLEINNRIFFLKWKDGLYDLDISSYVNFSSNRSSRTRSSNANLL